MATMTGTGIYLVTVQLADRRALEYAGAEDEYTGWLRAGQRRDGA